ncbi:ATP-grasp fold amidoligase family protein [Sedimentimonas flavescens]|uniref:ATP-grasp fold amidoligase family protein n=1 Tax=Sedimentimonas flavescens TaxID=2851012 RepID=UPI0021A7B8E0|nr:ATP-grasp fold amidoligase family protein [Sedimentimonas flavescens]MCT2538306.1 hypothetical protein [Sedimentimonas flavescens]
MPKEFINLANIPFLRRWDYKNMKVREFEKQHGYTPNFDNPKRFSEKLIKRILFDHEPYYLLYGNKAYAPIFFGQRKIEGLHFAKRFKVRRTLVPSDFDDLPNRFVVKTSYGSGLTEIVNDKASLDVPAVCERFNRILPHRKNAHRHEFPYYCAVFDEHLGPAYGEPAADYKFHCFRQKDGSYEALLRYGDGRSQELRLTWFDEALEKLSIEYGTHREHDELPRFPDQIDEMFRIAKQIAAGFDYIRVDLFLSEGKVYLGEVSPFGGGGKKPIKPVEWDFKLGEMWHQTSPCFNPTEAGIFDI